MRHRYIKNRIDVISLGCSKNLIDSELLLRRLEQKGYEFCHNPSETRGEWVIVNTCGFINDAKEESIEMLLALGEEKRLGHIGKIAVMGCLSQRYMDELKAELPEIDLWYGKFDWKAFIEQLPDKPVTCSSPDDHVTSDTDVTSNVTSPKPWERILTTPKYSAYIKISEGCNRFCSFCAIPLITGRHTSRPIEEILEEVKTLVSEGVKEFNIIAQDLSSYGTDLYSAHKLPELIDRMAEIEGVEWIRLHYAYPADFPDEILDVMARHDNVCKYLDIALQHISDPVLTNMRRHITGAETRELIKKMRDRVPGLKLRTTLMVGFPGEGEKEYQELLEFVREAKFDRMGAFAYSEEEDTFGAENFEDNIPQEIKQQRLDRLMQLQEEIALELNEEMVGLTVKVLIDSHQDGFAVGRTQWDSPEVDPEVWVADCDAQPGEFVNVRITEAYPFELHGYIAD